MFQEGKGKGWTPPSTCRVLGIVNCLYKFAVDFLSVYTVVCLHLLIDLSVLKEIIMVNTHQSILRLNVDTKIKRLQGCV